MTRKGDFWGINRCALPWNSRADIENAAWTQRAGASLLLLPRAPRKFATDMLGRSHSHVASAGARLHQRWVGHSGQARKAAWGDRLSARDRFGLGLDRQA